MIALTQMRNVWQKEEELWPWQNVAYYKNEQLLLQAMGFISTPCKGNVFRTLNQKML